MTEAETDGRKTYSVNKRVKFSMWRWKLYTNKREGVIQHAM